MDESFAYRQSRQSLGIRPVKKWESALHQAARAVMRVSPFPTEQAEQLAQMTVKFLQRRAYRLSTKTEGLKSWERELLASAYKALGREPLPIPGTQIIPRNTSRQQPWWRSLVPEESGGMGEFLISSLTIAVVQAKIRKNGVPKPPRPVVQVVGSRDTARKLLAKLAASVDALPEDD